ncbi:MAG: hypothetical protein U7123_15945 [Potamolinea sp.]
MNLIVPDCHRFADLNPLLLINQLSAGSVALSLVLGLSVIKPAHANSSVEKTTRLAKSQAQQQTNFRKPQSGEGEASWDKLSPTESPLSVLANSDSISVGTQISQEMTTVNHNTQKSSNNVPEPSVVAVRVVGNTGAVLQSVIHDATDLEDGASIQPSSTLARLGGEGELAVSKQTLAQLPYSPQTLPAIPVPTTPIPMGVGGSSSKVGQLPNFPQLPTGVPTSGRWLPVPPNSYNPMIGQPQYYQQVPMPMPGMGYPQPSNSYNPMMGQPQYAPQTLMLVPVQATGYSMPSNNYNPMMGQPQYAPQTFMLVPVQATGYPVSPNNYNPGMGQPQYYPQAAPPLPPPLNPNPVGYNYNPGMGQPQYYPQATPPLPLPLPLNPNPVGYNYNPALGQPQYYPQGTPTLPVQATPIPVVPNNYNPALGQPQYYPQAAPLVPVQATPIPVIPNNYNPALGQSPPFPQTPPALPVPPVTNNNNQQPTINNQQLFRSTALTSPSLQLQGLYINQGPDSSARARLGALYPLTPQLLFGATLDLTSAANRFADSPGQGLNINELYFSFAPVTALPNLRLVAGQLDLTSYFDRNSFAKDSATHFFNSVFQTNPALSTTGISSRPAVLINWTLTDNIEAKAAVFSSSRSLSDFALDGFAGEIGLRMGNAIIRGTYASDRDAGLRDGFKEIFQANRPDGTKGPRPSDREDSYGVNAEYFIPQLNMGIFGRYGRYENQALKRGGDTYSFGITFLDLIAKNDRLGLAYGRDLSNEQLRREAKADVPDVLELFYDFRFLPNLRLGFTLGQRNSFEDTYAGFRVKTEFDVTPRGILVP